MIAAGQAMGFFDWLRGPAAAEAAAPAVSVAASAGTGRTFDSLTDGELLEWIRTGTDGVGPVSVKEALRNTAVLRSVELISGSIGMLPMRVVQDGSKDQESPDHWLWPLLMRKPNPWQTPFEFKQLMQMRLLVRGNAYARIVKLGGKAQALIPLDPARMSVDEEDDLTPIYSFTRRRGGMLRLAPDEVLHLRGLSLDGIEGLSKVELAADQLTLARDAQTAAAKMFRNGMMVGGWLSHPGKLSDTARANILKSLEERHSGAANAHKWGLLEEGVKAEQNKASSTDAQNVETRHLQVEEISRLFGVPRPLLNMDDTSWGSGIEQLALLFVRFGIGPWFRVWEEGCNRALLTDADVRQGYGVDIDERELLRGSQKDQAEFFAKALGSGGHRAWMTPNEVRDLSGMPSHPDGDALEQGNQGSLSVSTGQANGGQS